jgi:hypothetical protein
LGTAPAWATPNSEDAKPERGAELPKNLAKSAAIAPPDTVETMSPPRQFEAPALRIQWDGSDACRPAADVAEHLRRLLGASNVTQIRKLDVRIAITAVPNGFDLVLDAETAEGHLRRALEVANCGDLAEAVALVLSVWLSERAVPATAQTSIEDGIASSAPAVAPTSTSPSNDDVPLVGALPRVSQVRFTPTRWRERLRAEAGGTLAFGVLPEQAQGAFAGITARAFALRWSLRGLWLQELTHLAQRSPRALGGRFGLIAAELRVAREFPLTSELALETFAWSMLGKLRAEGVGADEVAVSSGDFGALGLGAATVVRRGRFHLGIEGALGFPWGRPRYLVDETVVFRPPPLLGLLGIRAGVGFL